MGLSCRMFLLDQNEHLYRLTNTKFAQMLRDPARHRFPQFAGSRARVADVIVELVSREPIRVIRITFDILTFDHEGCLDPRLFGEQQFARSELAIGQSIAVPDSNSNVVDAVNQFIAQGGRWTPSRALAQAIDDAALGRIKCPCL